jgi:hypothetical protein
VQVASRVKVIRISLYPKKGVHMALAYYGMTIPDKTNWVETPEGYIIFKNCVIGRTGFQVYKGYEVDQQELEDQGIKIADNDDISLYRDPEEVFSARTMASFVCKSVTDGHPSELLSLENVKDHEAGQVINVRRGAEPLDSGDFPLLADLIVKSKNLLDKIKAGLRELSCGYNYHVLKDGNLIKQVDIIGNHVAVVEQARAGREAVIVDAAIPSIERKSFMSTWLDRILNSNPKPKLIAWAKDANPEEIADVITSLGTELEQRPLPVTTTVKVVEKAVAKDSDATDSEAERNKQHKMLDRFLDSKDEEKEAEDSDMKAFCDMFKRGRSSKDSAADAAKDKDKEEDDPEEEGDDEAADEAADEANDEEGALTIEPSDRPVPAGPGTDSVAMQNARAEGAKAVLRALKPAIAQSGNKKLIKAFDTAARTIQGKSTGKTSGGYSKVVEAASSRGKDAKDSKPVDVYADADRMYKERLNIVKR